MQKVKKIEIKKNSEEKEEKFTIHDFQTNLNSNKITEPENENFLLDDEQFIPTNGETKKKRR
jgi:hypothetical protein